MSILSWGVIALRTLMIMRMRKLSHAIEAFWNNIRAESGTRLAAVKQLDHENLVTPLAQAMDSANSRSALERKLSAAVRQSEQTLDQGLTRSPPSPPAHRLSACWARFGVFTAP